MRPALILTVALLACSQPPSTTGPAGSSGSALGAAALPATASMSSRSDHDDERDLSVPAEKFSDAQRSFEQAKKLMLTEYYDGSFTEDDLYRAAVAGMLERVDPKMHKWNRLLSPSEMADLKSDLSGEVVGVGLMVDFDAATGYVQVKGTLPGSPAERAGIAPPDQIVTVDGKLYRGKSLRDAVADIRGKSGETVTLSILRGDKLVSVPVVRERVVFDQVSHSLLPGDVGYLRIPGFNTRTPQAVHDALADVASKGGHALVVDLRHSPGGSFDDAVASLGALVPAGSTVATLKKRDATERVVPKTAPVLASGPIAVLVDHETASSAELFTAALQELRHATVVGSKTRGKWTVQKVEDLPNGYAVKYTMAIFTSPGGKSFDGTGIVPEVEVDQGDEATQRALMESDPAKQLAEDAPLRTTLALLAQR
ncbi:MAG: S41 family peptidase [Polyangiaceae bacterium]